MDLLKLKYKRFHKNPIKKIISRRNSKNSQVIWGIVGLKSLENGLITLEQLESLRKVLSKKLKKNSKLWIRINPTMTKTLKLGDKRMGKGKGVPVTKIFKVIKGNVIVEIESFFFKTVISLLRRAKKKLPIKLKIVYKKSL